MKLSEFKITFYSKVMMEKLLKITEIATLPKSVQFPNYQRYRSQILIAQIEDMNKDCVDNFSSISLLVWKLCTFRQRRNFGKFKQFFHYYFRHRAKFRFMIV